MNCSSASALDEWRSEDSFGESVVGGVNEERGKDEKREGKGEKWQKKKTDPIMVKPLSVPPMWTVMGIII